MSGPVNSLATYDLRTPVSSNHDLLFEINNKLELCKSQISIALNYVKNDAGLTKDYLKDQQFMLMIESDGNRCEKMRNILHEMQNILRELQYLIQSNERDSGISLSGTGSERSSLERDSGNMETLQESGKNCDLPVIPKHTGQKKESLLQELAIDHDVSNGQETEKNAANEQTIDATLVELIGNNEGGDAHGMETRTTSFPDAERQAHSHSEDHLNNLSNDSSDEDNTHQDSGVEKREKQMLERPTTAVCASTMSLGEDEQKLLDANSVSRKGKSQQRKEAAEHQFD